MYLRYLIVVLYDLVSTEATTAQPLTTLFNRNVSAIPLKMCKKCCGLRKNCIYLRCEEAGLGTRVPNFCTYRNGFLVVWY